MSKQSVRLTVRLNLEHPLYKGFGRLYDDLPEDAQGKKVGVQKLIEQAIAHTYGGFNQNKKEDSSNQGQVPIDNNSVEISDEVIELGGMSF